MPWNVLILFLQWQVPGLESIPSKRPMGLDALLKNQIGHGPKFQKLHIHFLTQDVEIKHIFALWAAVSEIMAGFQNCHIWAWNLGSGQSSRSCTYTLFLPQEGEIGLMFALRAVVSKIRANFQICHILGMKLGKCRSCTLYSLSTPGGSKFRLVLLYGQWFPRYEPSF